MGGSDEKKAAVTDDGALTAESTAPEAVEETSMTETSMAEISEEASSAEVLPTETLPAETSSSEEAVTETESASETESEPETEPAAAPSEEEPEAESSPAVQESQVVEIKIVKGDDSGSVARKLQLAGLIDNAKEFDAYLMQHGYDKTISVGTVEITKGAVWQEIAEIISGKKR